MSDYDDIKEKLKLALRQISGKLEEEDTLLPEIAIRGQGGILYCYYPAKKRFIRIRRGVKAFVISEEEVVSPDRILIYTFDGHLVEIEKDEIIHTGYD
tara:strand:- start:10213 stop:10506 length:294 start_codon:yes stop_codon:yes gene_type:complete